MDWPVWPGYNTALRFKLSIDPKRISLMSICWAAESTSMLERSTKSSYVFVKTRVCWLPTLTRSIRFSMCRLTSQSTSKINETHIVSSRTVNQFIVSAKYLSAIFQQPNPTAALAAFPTTVTLGD